MTTNLHLVRLRLDLRQLYRGSSSSQDVDEDYLVHGALTALFDYSASDSEKVAPKPFFVSGRDGSSVEVLGYSAKDAAALRERVRVDGSSDISSALFEGKIESRGVPLLAEGTRLQFRVRACPTRRLSGRSDPTRSGEVDAFYAKTLQVSQDVPLDREEIYREWLGEQLARAGGVELESLKVTRMQQRRLHRKTQGKSRAVKMPTFPDVGFEGVLRVTDAQGFREMIARGVGRHRAFGFGMLLVRSAETES